MERLICIETISAIVKEDIFQLGLKLKIQDDYICDYKNEVNKINNIILTIKHMDHNTFRLCVTRVTLVCTGVGRSCLLD